LKLYEQLPDFFVGAQGRFGAVVGLLCQFPYPPVLCMKDPLHHSFIRRLIMGTAGLTLSLSV
jgi:hypothetical protein